MIKQYPQVETERDGAVLIIRLSNEAAHNSLTREVRFSLRDIVREIEDDRTIRAVYLTAKGKTFCAGGDLRMLTDASNPWQSHRRFRHAGTLFPSLATLDRMVVVGVRGAAIGGGLGIALMGDTVVAGESAKFVSGFFRLGVLPDCLTLYTLPRLIGLAKTRQFLFTNSTWSADQALQNGIVSQVVPDDEVDAVGLALAHKFANGPAEVMGLSKTIMMKSFESSINEMMDYEDLGQSLAQNSPEFEEGLQALIEKRPAEFSGTFDGNDPNADGMPSMNNND